MITPRITRLVRVADLRGMHRAIARSVAATTPAEAHRHAVIVATSGAAESLRRTLESLTPDGANVAPHLPEMLTRDGLYERLQRALPDPPPMLSGFDREVLFRRAASAAAALGAPPPFSLRPGLIVEILAFYDDLRRRHRTVHDFDRLMTDSLAGSVEIDRGAERMMRQTRFLALAFEAFERNVAASGSIDEHGLRGLLLEAAVRPPFTRFTIAVADQAADPGGLWAVDYDLLARISGVETIDVIATENLLATGYHERIHDHLPGIVEEPRGEPAPPPALAVPVREPDRPAARWFTCRDREEELAAIVRDVITGAARGRVGVVFQRPLPYLYLARHVFADAGLSYEALDALPLAAEPFAAAVDLVFSGANAEATRASLLELLGSPHWRFETPDGDVLSARETAALDELLQKAKYLGGWGRLAALAPRAPEVAGRHRGLRARAERALIVAARVSAELQALAEAPSASAQIRGVLSFIGAHERQPLASDPWYAAHMRARAAILGALESLAAAHERHDEGAPGMAEVAGTLRRWIEGQTFSPRTGTGGVRLLDAPAAAFADVDELRIVGLVESDWPDRAPRCIFYPASLLSQLGWPPENDRLAAERARFLNLLTLARTSVSVSTFTLENDAIVAASPFLEEIEGAGLAVEARPDGASTRVFAHEALAGEPTIVDAARGSAAEWLALRASRAALDSDRFRGAVGPREVASHAVSHLERYLDCPFKYFARYVLSLDEEREDESVLSPLERGQLLHDVFEQFFGAWDAAGHRGITAANLPQALGLFEKIADARLASLSETDRGLERTYLLGSAVASGLAERAFAFEIEHGVDVVERLLEHPLEGEFEFKGGEVSRRLHIRAKVDRIDLLADGTLRIVDYKLGRAPKPARALQLPVYGVCAAQGLEGYRGRTWTVSRAGYVAFRERNAFVPLGGSSSLEAALESGQERLLATVSAIERGEFPVDPDEPFLCTRCGYSGVCRKDYVGDE